MREFFHLFGRSKLTVLMFHKVPVQPDGLFPYEMDLQRFSLLLEFLLENFRIVSLRDALTGLRGNALPPAAACLTFDDGYSDWFAGVVPLLQRHSLPATFFITTSQLHGEPLWYERITHAVRHSTLAEIDLPAMGLARQSLIGESERAHAVQQLVEYCKYQNLEARREILATLEDALGKPEIAAPCMNTEEIRRLAALGFEIGAHTVNHPILRFCSPEEARFEIAAAKEVLEGLIGNKVDAFAYPNGKIGLDVLAEHVGIARHCGYTCALTTQPGVASGGHRLLQIPRFTPWGGTKTRMAMQMARNLFVRPQYLAEAN